MKQRQIVFIVFFADFRFIQHEPELIDVRLDQKDIQTLQIFCRHVRHIQDDLRLFIAGLAADLFHVILIHVFRQIAVDHQIIIFV